MIEQHLRSLWLPRAIVQGLEQVAAAQEAHHQKSPIRVTPVIVQGHDMRVLQARDRLCFSLKAADKLRVIGIAAVDDFDGYLTADCRLHGAINLAIRSRANLFFQIIGSFAEFEKRQINERTAGGKSQKIEKGLFTAGKIPYGYRIEKSEILEVVEDEAANVKKMFQLRAEKKSVRKIAVAVFGDVKKYGTRIVENIWTSIDKYFDGADLEVVAELDKYIL